MICAASWMRWPTRLQRTCHGRITVCEHHRVAAHFD
jgi:hypothetical protein